MQLDPADLTPDLQNGAAVVRGVQLDSADLTPDLQNGAAGDWHAAAD